MPVRFDQKLEGGPLDKRVKLTGVGCFCHLFLAIFKKEQLESIRNIVFSCKLRHAVLCTDSRDSSKLQKLFT